MPMYDVLSIYVRSDRYVDSAKEHKRQSCLAFILKQKCILSFSLRLIDFFIYFAMKAFFFYFILKRTLLLLVLIDYYNNSLKQQHFNLLMSIKRSCGDICDLSKGCTSYISSVCDAK